MTLLSQTYPIRRFDPSHLPDHPWLAELWRIQRPPRSIAVQGSEQALELLGELPKRGLGIVGTRSPSPRSARLLKTWMQTLGGTRLIIVSGFALGIDSIAHRAALDAGLPTVAILGAGLNRNYPQPNAELRERILACGGLLVSEFADDASPQAWQFLLRNRMIAAWSKAVWVVEASQRSGALNTAKWAREHERLCFATPCSPGDPDLAGNQDLIDFHHALPFWGPHSLGAAWLEYSSLGVTTPSPSRGSSSKLQEIQNAQLQLFPAASYERLLMQRLGGENQRRGGVSTNEMMDWALAQGWSFERFFEALGRLQEIGLLLERKGLLLKKDF